MKKLLLLSLSAVMAFGANASISKLSANQMIATAAPSTESLLFATTVGCYYEPTITPANYYFIVSTDSNAKYDANSGTLSVTDGWVLSVDCYNETTEPIALPQGTYTAGDGSEAFTFDPSYSLLQYFDADGKEVSTTALSNDVSIVRAGNTYTVTTTVTVDGIERAVSFTGLLPFDDITETPTVYPQVRRDTNETYKGALAYYHGNAYETNTGNIYIDLYTNAYNPESGGMIENGYSLNLCLFNKLFSDSKSATPIAGTYIVSRSMDRFTYFPGMEIDYMGYTLIFGSYLKCREGDTSDDYSYAYLAAGEIVITDNGDGTYTINVDCLSDMGYKVQGTFTGSIPVEDVSEDSGGAAVSTLEDDVELNLGIIPRARVYNNGVKNGCRAFILDIGSPSGKDEELKDGGDIMRVEFLCEAGDKYIPDGTYYVMENRYSTSYAPFMLEPGYFGTNSAGQATGELVGTRYNHFKVGSYWVYDEFAPAASGTVAIQENSDDTHTVQIAIVDDGGFHIDGNWRGPLLLQYNPELITAIDGIDADADNVEIHYIDANTINITGVPSSATLQIFSTTGACVKSLPAAGSISIADLAAGVYVLRVANKTFKIAK